MESSSLVRCLWTAVRRVSLCVRVCVCEIVSVCVRARARACVCVCVLSVSFVVDVAR